MTSPFRKKKYRKDKLNISYVKLFFFFKYTPLHPVYQYLGIQYEVDTWTSNSNRRKGEIDDAIT